VDREQARTSKHTQAKECGKTKRRNAQQVVKGNRYERPKRATHLKQWKGRKRKQEAGRRKSRRENPTTTGGNRGEKNTILQDQKKTVKEAGKYI